MKTKLPLVPTIFTIAAMIVLLALGSWQAKRLLWKNGIIAEISERIAQPAIPFPSGEIKLDDVQYRIVSLTGHFLHDKEIHLFTGPREMRGKPGYDVITPLEQKNGKVVLVDRGWVPVDKKDSKTRPETLLKGDITINGMVIAGERKGMFTPDNDSVKNLWFWLDIPAIASFTGKELDNVYVRAVAENEDKDALPVPGTTKVEIRNDHLQYAITWYSLAVILAVIYVIYVRGARK